MCLRGSVFQVHHHRVAAHARVPVLRAVPADQTAGDRQHRAPVQAGRLDAAVRARRQHRLGRVPGHRARFVAPTGVVPQQDVDGAHGGRVTHAAARVTGDATTLKRRTPTTNKTHWSVLAGGGGNNNKRSFRIRKPGNACRRRRVSLLPSVSG